MHLDLPRMAISQCLLRGSPKIHLRYRMGIMKKQSGFSLIELAISLVIIGLVMSAAISVGNTQIAQSRINTTKTKEVSLKTALLTFISHNNRLPCPAQNVVPGTSSQGTEAFDTVNHVCTFGVNGTVAVGVVPWVTLGLPEDAVEDGYYNLFTYAVSTSAVALVANQNALPLVSVAAMSGSINTYSAAPVGAPTLLNSGFVALILSNGINGFGAYTTNGTQIASNAGTDEAVNSDGDNTFIVKDFSNNTTNPFDDIVLPLSVSDLLTPLTITGSIDDVNVLLQKDYNYIAGYVPPASLHAGVGSGYTLPGTIPFVYDPWGHLIIYTVNTTTIPVCPSPILQTSPEGVAYTLTSTGSPRIIYVSDLQSIFTTYGW
jgi:prepilin-type N-terminal cleavage/methylation domain-containing protein